MRTIRGNEFQFAILVQPRELREAMRIRACSGVLVAGLAALAGCDQGAGPQQDAGPTGLAAGSRPNILLIVADDLGYQDLGLFGGEIRTPAIDGLAASGVVLSNFYASVACQPTRAMLMSGADHHIAGVGSQGRVIEDNPAYQNRLTARVASIAERLSDLDYHTSMAGKWHLGEQAGQTPADRGFERSFVLLQPGAFHFDLVSYGANAAVTYQDDGVELTSLPEDFYSTIAYTDRMIGYIDEAAASGRPFFGYLAYTAPHWPIQALDEDMARVRGRYDEGYDVVRERRFQRLKDLGYFPSDAAAPRLAAALRPWSELTPEQQAEERAVMEAYAAMVERLDMEIGRLLRHLDEIGQLDDTLVVFMSDNGAEGTADGPFQAEYRAQFDNSLENIGRRNSYRLIGLGWGEAGAAGDFLTKGSLAQGGIHVPVIVSAPALGSRIGRSNALVAALDLAPTFVELAGGTNATNVGGREVLPMTGRSLTALLRGETEAVRAPDEALAFAHGPQRAVFRGDWKALWIAPPNGIGDWQLFDLAQDPGETTDLSAVHPQVMTELAAAWERHAEEVGYAPPAGRGGGASAQPPDAAPGPTAR
jgi:arylsulfatase A-like enzyme